MSGERIHERITACRPARHRVADLSHEPLQVPQGIETVRTPNRRRALIDLVYSSIVVLSVSLIGWLPAKQSRRLSRTTVR
jgi:hypothetical protein